MNSNKKRLRKYPLEKTMQTQPLLPAYYRFAKYFILVCIEIFVILLIAWSFPTEKIFFLLKEFFLFLILIAIFLYLYFLVIEYEAKKRLQTKKELEKRTANLSILVMTAQKISQTLNFNKRIRGGFAGLACLLTIRKGIALLSLSNEKYEIAATYHLDRKKAETAVRYLKEKQYLVQGEKIPLLSLKKHCFRNAETNETLEWKNLQIINLLTKKNSLGFLILDAEIPDEKRETAEFLCRQLSAALENSLLHQKVEIFSLTDPLTELHNLRFFYRRLSEELNRSRRFSLPFSLMLSDIDDFKGYVDGNGHRMGDDALKKIGALAKESLRKIDVVARYGGDEFAYLLPQTNAESAKIVAQRIKDAVSGYSFPAKNGFTGLTLSIGIASFPEDAQESDNLMEKSDRALFQAKSRGKNRVCLWKE